MRIYSAQAIVKPRWDLRKRVGKCIALGMLVWLLPRRDIMQTNWKEAAHNQVLPSGWKRKNERYNQCFSLSGHCPRDWFLPCLTQNVDKIVVWTPRPLHPVLYTDIIDVCYLSYCYKYYIIKTLILIITLVGSSSLFQQSPDTFSGKPWLSWMNYNDSNQKALPTKLKSRGPTH